MTNGKTNRIILLLGFLLLLVATISASTAADTIYVDNATGSDGNDGLTPTTAKATIQNGTDTVDPEGTVYVADGTYNEQVVINKNLNLIGQSQSGTIISGTNTGRPVTINQATVTLTSFTIQDGNNVQFGGGIYNYFGNLTVNNCIIQLNTATISGGGIYNMFGNLTVYNSLIQQNTASSSGGGISNYGTDPSFINHSTIQQNTANGYGGGGVYNGGYLIITDSNILQNTGTLGSAILKRTGNSLVVNFCRIYGNTGFYSIYDDSASPVNNNVEDNWWGANAPQFSQLLRYIPFPTHWLYMTINATPSTIGNRETSLVTVSFNNRSDGTTVTPFNPAVGHIPDLTPVLFETDLGNLGSKTINRLTLDGIATATLTADETPGIAKVNGTTDAQEVSTDVTIIPKSSLYLKVTPSKTNPVPGDTVTYSLKVGNNGPDPAENVVMTYTIPEGLEFAGASDDVGNTWTYDPVTRTITWTLGTVPMGDPTLLLQMRYLRAGFYLINPLLSTTTYDPTLNQETQSLTVNAQNIATAAVLANTVGMKSTGVPLAGMLLALLMVITGFYTARRK
ncbi:DUF11 domain-containing protein [Methanobacterium sp. 42_16]|uniref:DUF11 domain-containing protein n=1 Tax=Methanobacterium sp. 42_16 TaxID=1641383 RepID=UPI000748889F|nr:DUF11 domain-containing protein [Methanobacterium sp. 42_16]KUK74720.1 MAG: Polymorphic outer membrane protein [Methanobacterium sp. 42_16]